MMLIDLLCLCMYELTVQAWKYIPGFKNYLADFINGSMLSCYQKGVKETTTSLWLHYLVVQCKDFVSNSVYSAHWPKLKLSWPYSDSHGHGM